MATRRRYTRGKDSLGRAYVIDRTTGKRASLAKYERESKARARERERAKAASEPVRTGPRYSERTDRLGRPFYVDNGTGKRVSRDTAKRSIAAQKGVITRRANAEYVREERAALQADEFVPVDRLGPAFEPPGLAERAEQFPRVQAALDEAAFMSQRWAEAKIEYATLHPDAERVPSASDIARGRMAEASKRSTLELDAEAKAIAAEGEYSLREIYTLHFSPDAA